MFVFATALSANAVAAELSVGSKVEAFALSDQFDGKLELTAKTRLVLFTREKDAAKMVFGVLDEKDKNFLADRQAYLAMDISPMPRIIAWAVAKPRMRRHAFRFMLDASGETTKSFPGKAGQVTLLYLNELAVERIAFVATAAELKKELESLPPAR